MKKIAIKDKDLMSDTGGESKRYRPTQGRPPREKNPLRDRMQTDETRDDGEKDADLISKVCEKIIAFKTYRALLKK